MIILMEQFSKLLNLFFYLRQKSHLNSLLFRNRCKFCQKALNPCWRWEGNIKLKLFSLARNSDNRTDSPLFMVRFVTDLPVLLFATGRLFTGSPFHWLTFLSRLIWEKATLIISDCKYRCCFFFRVAF